MNLQSRLHQWYGQANRITGGVLGILSQTIRSFQDARAPEAAASMSYYAVFSLFPLLLALIVIGSFFLEQGRAYSLVIEPVVQAFPTSQRMVESNIRTVLRQRGSVGLVGLIGLLWAGMGMFTTLARNIDRAWPDAPPRTFLESRLLALGMVGIVALLLLLSLASTAVTSILPQLEVPLAGKISIYDTMLWKIVSRLIPWIFSFMMLFGLYRWIPNTEVPTLAAVWGAGIAAVAWELAKVAFAWYLQAGLGSYELIYGSLEAVVALMFWVYLSGLIALFGAHLGAAIARRERMPKKETGPSGVARGWRRRQE